MDSRGSQRDYDELPRVLEESTDRQTEIRLPYKAENAENTQSPVLPVSWR